MSWRVIFAVLIVLAGASAWGGLRLGDWLVAHGPVAPPVLEHPELANNVPVLAANGLPYTAQPPQPLMNGEQGVPKEIGRAHVRPPVTNAHLVCSLLTEKQKKY